MAPKIAIIYYSTWGHVKTLADAEKKGIEEAGGTADLYQIRETLPDDILAKMHAPPKPTDIPILENPEQLLPYDGFLFGIPTRFGNFPAQWKTLIDSTGKLWFEGRLQGKMAGIFVSTGTLGGGQELTALSALSTLVAHGIIFVPLGCSGRSKPILMDLGEVRGGSSWGAGTFSSADGSRQPSEKELELATIQGNEFYKTVAKYNG